MDLRSGFESDLDPDCVSAFDAGWVSDLASDFISGPGPGPKESPCLCNWSTISFAPA